MTGYMLFGLVIVLVTFFILAMFFIVSLVKKIRAWFESEPLVQFTVDEIDQDHEFTVPSSGKYVFCLTVRRNLKPVRPPMHKVNIVISNSNHESLDLNRGIFAYKRINDMNFQETHHVLAEFMIETPGMYFVKIVGDKGTYHTDKFFIRPKLGLFKF